MISVTFNMLWGIPYSVPYGFLSRLFQAEGSHFALLARLQYGYFCILFLLLMAGSIGVYKLPAATALIRRPSDAPIHQS